MFRGSRHIRATSNKYQKLLKPHSKYYPISLQSIILLISLIFNCFLIYVSLHSNLPSTVESIKILHQPSSHIKIKGLHPSHIIIDNKQHPPPPSNSIINHTTNNAQLKQKENILPQKIQQIINQSLHANLYSNVLTIKESQHLPFNDLQKRELTHASPNARRISPLIKEKLYITESEVKIWFHNRFFVFEDTKTAFCVMEKNSCTMFKQIFKRIRGKRDYLSTDYAQIHYLPYRGLTDISFYEEKDLQRVLNDNDFYFAAFVREPLERLVSGYIDKCVKKRGVNLCDYARWSPLFINTYGGTYGTMRSRSFLPSFDIWADGLFHCPCWPETDWHFAPQWNFCNLYQYVDKYDIFRFENRSHRQLWMERAGYWEKYGKQGWSNDRNYSKSIVEYGPQSHSSTNVNRTSDKYIKLYSDMKASLFAEIIDAYRNDYIIFGIQMPVWLCDISIIGSHEVKRAIRSLPRTSRPPCVGKEFKWIWERE